jgi:hypothetical protein
MSDIEDRLDELEDTAYLDGCALHAAMEILTVARALLKERDESPQPINNQHNEPADCPTWHDGCNCNVETLVYNIERAENAEARSGELLKEVMVLRNAVATYFDYGNTDVLLAAMEPPNAH